MSTTPSTPFERLRDGYTETPDPKHERRRTSIARSFKPNEQMERLAALPEDTREALFARNPTLRMSLGSYVESKKIYEELKGQ